LSLEERQQDVPRGVSKQFLYRPSVGSYSIQNPGRLDKAGSTVPTSLGTDDCFFTVPLMTTNVMRKINKNDKPKATIVLRLVIAITLATHHADSWTA
jgi:hypothetical protein